MAKAPAPEIVELSTTQLEALLVKLATLVPAETYRLLESVLRTFQWLVSALEAKNTTLGRLRRMLFGKQTEKTAQVLPQSVGADRDPPPPTKTKGHGRHAAQDYPAPSASRCRIPNFTSGNSVPSVLKANFTCSKPRRGSSASSPSPSSARRSLNWNGCVALCAAPSSPPPPHRRRDRANTIPAAGSC